MPDKTMFNPETIERYTCFDVQGWLNDSIRLVNATDYDKLLSLYINLKAKERKDA